MFYTRDVESIKYDTALSYFKQFAEDVPGFLLESVDIAPIYGRLSIFSIDPPLEVVGSGEDFYIRALNDYGKVLLSYITEETFAFCSTFTKTESECRGTVKRAMEMLDESKRQQQTNISSVIRALLKIFAIDDPYLGLYGAFSYDFVRQFEDIPNVHAEGAIPDFHLFLPDVLYVFDHLKQTAEIRYYNFSQVSLSSRLTGLPRTNELSQPFSVTGLESSCQRSEYEESVLKAKNYMKKGDIFEIVISRKFSGSCTGSTIDLYTQYCEINPSPYMFYYRFPIAESKQLRTLLGASPEMFVRVEDNIVMTRPISGTAIRSNDPIEDYENMLDLLNSQKEKSELDMLIDLARNDVSRVCEPGIAVKDYRYVEKYSKVMHTIAHVEGNLDVENFSAFDAFIACLNAGTLTGAPKIRAMELIEEMEIERRGYYGGNVGYITFNNELNTGIIIRSAVIEDGSVSTQVGATLLLDSQPTAEFDETTNKASALLSVLTP
ncbi:MAG: chorismate-binding protein [bacterium]|nr:chorismate-binding protein [bacterium]